MGIIPSGVEPFDERAGGLTAGGFYVLAGAPGVGKLAFLLQFLAAGLGSGEKLALLGGHAPEELFARARHWGLAELETAWREDRLHILGFRGEYPRRILRAPDPAVAFVELAALLAGPIDRLAVDPGTLLWETRADGSLASSFLEWQQASGTTVVATAVADLDENLPPSTRWVIQRASGAFQLGRTRRGLRELTVYHTYPPIEDPGAITLDLRIGRGLTRPTGAPDRRSGDVAPRDRRKLLCLRLSEAIGPDVDRWLRTEYEVRDVEDPTRLASALRSEGWGGVCIAVDRARIDEAVGICREIRELTPGTILLLSRGQLRSSDRGRAIEAGADDVIRQDVAMRELRSRFQRAAASGGGARATGHDPGRPSPIRDLADAAAFAAEVRSRLESPTLGYLTVILVPDTVDAEVLQALRDSVRIDTGDFVGRANSSYGVVLQDARGRHARIYLERALKSLGPTSGAPAVRILTSPEEADDIRSALGG